VALNQEFVGRAWPASDPYHVGREKIREFATAIGDPNPVFHDVAAAAALGHRDLVAPPTFPIVVTFRASSAIFFDPELGLDYSRVVHGEQRFVYARPLYAGDIVTVAMSIEQIRVAAGNDLITTRAAVATVEGEHVVDAYAVIVVRGNAEEGN